MVGLMRVYSSLQDIPVVDETFGELVQGLWIDIGGMKWPLLACVDVGVITIIWKFFDLFTKSSRTKKILGEVDGLLEDHRIEEALEATRNSDAPAAKILYAGLDRHDEGTERVMKAIENQGLI